MFGRDKRTLKGMNKAQRIASATACIIILVLLGGIFTYAEENNSMALENYNLKALGRLQQDVDNSGAFGDNPEDFVYDADDLYAIEGLVKEGKTELSSVINSYQTGDVLTLDTFTNLSSAIDSLSTFPRGKYYYDSTTGADDATTLIRYIKEGESYYLCDQYGNKTSDVEQTVTESNLVEYRGLTQENLSAGFAGMVDKTFVLGNGSDNITYRNQSKVGNATAEQVLAGKTFTSSTGVGLTGTMPNNDAWTNTPTAKGKVTIPVGYHNGSGYVDTTSIYNKGVTDGKATAKKNIKIVMTLVPLGQGEGEGDIPGTTTSQSSNCAIYNIGYKYMDVTLYDAYFDIGVIVDGSSIIAPTTEPKNLTNINISNANEILVYTPKHESPTTNRSRAIVTLHD